MPRRSIHSTCEEKFKTLLTAMSNKESRVNECEQVPHTPQSELASSNTMKSHNIGNQQFSPITMEESMRTRNDMPPDPKSKVKQCPRQPTNVECGFYVMRYMKEVIADESILSKKNFNGKTTYTQAEIDEVRVEWMNCVLEYDI